MRIAVVALLGALGCGSKDAAVVSIGGYTLVAPAGYRQVPADEDGELELDGHGMTVRVRADTVDLDTSSSDVCNAFVEVEEGKGFTVRSVAIQDLPVGSVCRLTVAYQGQVNERIYLHGAPGLIVSCVHDDGGGSLADCDAIFSSIRQR